MLDSVKGGHIDTRRRDPPVWPLTQRWAGEWAGRLSRRDEGLVWSPANLSPLVGRETGCNGRQGRQMPSRSRDGQAGCAHRGGATCYHLFNHLGTTLALASSAQALTDTYRRNAWGVELASSFSTRVLSQQSCD